MKHELHLALVAMAVPANHWWTELSPLRKAAIALFAAFVVGASVGAWGIQAFEVPRRLAAVEQRIDDHQIEHTEISAYREENTCMLKRLMCRLDGDTANNCDLRFAVRDGRCPNG